MKLLAILMFFGVGVALSSAIYYECYEDGDTYRCSRGQVCHNHRCVRNGRLKREAISVCKTDNECGKGDFCILGFCSSDGTKHTFERLQTAKSIRSRKKHVQKKIEKRSTWPHCVDDFECKSHESCHGGVCRSDH